MKILTVSEGDRAGGANSVASSLFREFKKLGHYSWLSVGRKFSNDFDVNLIPNQEYRSKWKKYWRLKSALALKNDAKFLKKIFEFTSSPADAIRKLLGHENFNFPGTSHLFENLPSKPDIISCHNLHGDYFDLRKISEFSQKTPLILSLHDAWLLSGHCAHSFGCERWKSGCGKCPDLLIPPEIKRDATNFNWQKKRAIYQKSKLYVTTPCQWLMDKVKNSILMEGVIESRVIPYGIDLTVFNPGDLLSARTRLEIPQDAIVLLFSGNSLTMNPWKDFSMVRDAMKNLATENSNLKYIFIALGGSSKPENIGNVELRFIPFEPNRTDTDIALYYQASDLYLHPAKADTFPLAVLEAQACGKPVIATSVGGIPEQIVDFNSDPENATGILVPSGDANKMKDAISFLSNQKEIRIRLSKNSLQRAKNRFDITKYAQKHIEWYLEILK